jgi:hypothetical protein
MTSIPLETSKQLLVDDAIRAYVDWREECRAVWDAYRGWGAAKATDGALAFAVYTAALDREQQASDVYADMIRRVGDSVTADREHGTALAASGKHHQ